jgi:hypothetical protein
MWLEPEVSAHGLERLAPQDTIDGENLADLGYPWSFTCIEVLDYRSDAAEISQRPLRRNGLDER